MTDDKKTIIFLEIICIVDNITLGFFLLMCYCLQVP
jgi:hypothetical protein